MNQEIWLPIADFPNYEVSSFGRVRRTTTNTSGKAGSILVGYRDKDGYHCVLLCACGTKKKKKVHRLVTEAFIGPIPKGMHVNHKNGVKDNNHVMNLEVVTPTENTKHGFRALGRPPSINPMKGVAHGNARFTDDDIRQIRLLYSQGMTQKKIAEMFKTGQTHISRITRREAWSHVS